MTKKRILLLLAVALLCAVIAGGLWLWYSQTKLNKDEAHKGARFVWVQQAEGLCYAG